MTPRVIGLLPRSSRQALNRRVWGEKHPETAITEVNLSCELLAGGLASEAVQVGRLALASFEATLGNDHPRTGAAAGTVADTMRAKKDSIGPEKLYRRALSIDEAAFEPNHLETLGDVKTLAEFLRALGRVSEALLLEQRLSGAEK